MQVRASGVAMGGAARWRSTTVATGSALVVAVWLLSGCATDGAGAGAASVTPSVAPSQRAACSPPPLVTPSEERTPGWLSGVQVPLQADGELIERYGADHADEFAGVWFDNEPWVRIVAAFTGNIDAHCAALRDVVAHPERLEVVQHASTVKERERIRDEIMPLMTPSGPIEELGIGRDHVFVGLRADAEDLAAELRGRYGDAVRLRVGIAPYPPSESPTAAAACDLGEIAEWPPGVSASVELADGVIASGLHTEGTVTIVNESAERFTAELGEPETGWVFEQGGTTPIGAFTGAVGGHGRRVDLAPGEHATLDMVVGTASCDPSRGYALAPGTYDVRVVLPAAYEETADGEMVPGPTWLSEPARLRVVDGTDS
jgi:hypothetical protein